MARTAIQPADMADPRPRYTHGWRVGNTVYVAGQLALDKAGTLVGPNDIKAQTRQIFENMRRILEAGGAGLRDVVKVTVFVTDIRYREGYGEARQEFFRTDPPASTLVQVACLAIPGALIEIEAVAVLDDGGR
jgi:reactive intermediate/imine deaminase